MSIFKRFTMAMSTKEFMKKTFPDCFAFIFNETVDDTAMEVMQEISRKHGQYEFMFTCLDVYTDYMPEIGIILSDDVSPEEVAQIGEEFNDLMDKKLSNNYPRDYVGLDMYPKNGICKDWLVDNALLKIYIQNGTVTEKSTREYAKHLTERIEQAEN